MRSYKCPDCSFIFSEADKAWDIAIDSGRCPECLEPIRNFPVPVREETLPPIIIPAAPSKLSDQNSSQQSRVKQKLLKNQPYPWQSVVGWAAVAFLVGLASAHPTWKSATLVDRVALGIVVGICYAFLTGAVVGSWKYFRRTPSRLLEATHQPWNGASAIRRAVGWRLWLFMAVIGVIYNLSGLLGGLVASGFWLLGFSMIDRYRASVARAGSSTLCSASEMADQSAYALRSSLPRDSASNDEVSHGSKEGRPTNEDSEYHVYEQISRELETDKVDRALWTKVYAQAGGDDRQTRVLYIKARFDRLLAIENARLRESGLEQ